MVKVAGDVERARNSVFAGNLRRLMCEGGLTTRDLAKKIGISHQAISQWLSAQNGPSNGRLARIANVFGVGIDQLISQPEPINAGPRVSNTAGEAGGTLPIRQLEAKLVDRDAEQDRPRLDESPAKMVVWTVPRTAIGDQASTQSNIAVIRVNDSALDSDVRAGDYIFADIACRTVFAPGIYLLVVAGLPAWRRCHPLLGEKVLVADRAIKQEVPIKDLVVLGRAVRLLTQA